MEKPGRMIQRAKQQKNTRKAISQHPMPISPPEVAPPHRSTHGEYSALMRSHDRVRTRHLGGQG